MASCIATLGCALAAPAIAAPRLSDRRQVSFYNLHTGESLDTVYWADGAYEPGALTEVNWILRDFRTGDIHPIDRRLLDLLVNLRDRLATGQPFHVISGYRSPATNAILASASEGVARHSLHMDGMAIDIRVPDRPLRTLHEAAIALKAGGVGFYPASDFVHVDTGRVRRWS